MKYDRWMTQREFAAKLGIGLSTLKRMRRSGDIRYCRFGYRTVRIRATELLKFVSDYEVRKFFASSGTHPGESGKAACPAGAPPIFQQGGE